MRRSWHTRRNTKGGKHRKVRRQPKHAVRFQEPKHVHRVRISQYRANGKPGTRPEAVIIDMDGTLENWDGQPNPPGLEYAQRHHDEGRVLIILTARDHEWSYQRTHDWLKKHIHMPFVGPICRPADDERYACDFKKAIYEQLSSVYTIVSAIDDDVYVLDMWRSIPNLDVVETNYSYQYHKANTGLAESYKSTSREDVRDQWEIDELEEAWLREYEQEVANAKRRQPTGGKPVPSWVKDWSDEIDGLDLYCNHCDHLWFNHDITGCNEISDCVCVG